MPEFVERIVVLTIDESWGRHGRDTMRMEGRTVAGAERHLEATGFSRVGVASWARRGEGELFRAHVSVELV
jgi:hypothetical protein